MCCNVTVTFRSYTHLLVPKSIDHITTHHDGWFRHAHYPHVADSDTWRIAIGGDGHDDTQAQLYDAAGLGLYVTAGEGTALYFAPAFRPSSRRRWTLASIGNCWEMGTEARTAGYRWTCQPCVETQMLSKQGGGMFFDISRQGIYTETVYLQIVTVQSTKNSNCISHAQLENLLKSNQLSL